MAITKQQVHAVINFVAQIEKMRGRDPMRVFRKGNCGSLHEFLATAFPGHVTPILTRYSGSDEGMVQGHHVVSRIHNDVGVNPADWLEFAEENHATYYGFDFFGKYDSGKKIMKSPDEIMGLLDNSAESKKKRKKYRESNWEAGAIPNEEVVGFFDIGKDFDITKPYEQKSVPDPSLLGPTIKFGYGRTSQDHQSYLKEEVERMGNTKKLIEMFIECKRKGEPAFIDIAAELRKLGDPGFERIITTGSER